MRRWPLARSGSNKTSGAEIDGLLGRAAPRQFQSRSMSNAHLLLFTSWFVVYVAMWLFVLQRLPPLIGP